MCLPEPNFLSPSIILNFFLKKVPLYSSYAYAHHFLSEVNQPKKRSKYRITADLVGNRNQKIQNSENQVITLCRELVKFNLIFLWGLLSHRGIKMSNYNRFGCNLVILAYTPNLILFPSNTHFHTLLLIEAPYTHSDSYTNIPNCSSFSTPYTKFSSI